MGRQNRTAHQHIMACFKKGTGCHLSREEVDALGLDDAIVQAALNADIEDEDLRKSSFAFATSREESETPG